MRSVQAPSPLLGAVCPRIPVIGCFKPVSARPWARRQHALRRQRSPGAVLCSRTELDAPETGFEASEPGPPEEASSAPALEEEEDEDEEEPRRSPIEEKLYAKFWELLDKEDISLKRGQKVGLDEGVSNVLRWLPFSDGASCECVNHCNCIRCNARICGWPHECEC